jgi:hypothetical protein
MRGCAVPGTLVAMSTSEPLQVVVDLEQTDETVKGHITVAGAATTAFFGWLELIDRLDRAVQHHCGPRTAGSTTGASDVHEL